MNELTHKSVLLAAVAATIVLGAVVTEANAGSRRGRSDGTVVVYGGSGTIIVIGDSSVSTDRQRSPVKRATAHSRYGRRSSSDTYRYVPRSSHFRQRTPQLHHSEPRRYHRTPRLHHSEQRGRHRTRQLHHSTPRRYHRTPRLYHGTSRWAPRTYSSSSGVSFSITVHVR